MMELSRVEVSSVFKIRHNTGLDRPVEPSAILAVPVVPHDEILEHYMNRALVEEGDGDLSDSDFTARTMLFTNDSNPYLNTTSLLVLSEGVEINYLALLMLVIPIFTALGNVMVILSVTTEKALQTSTNYLIVSLAVADLLVALLVMPWAIYVLVHGHWTLPFLACDLYIGMDVICSTASIFNLVAISIDRYEAVTQPLKYCQKQQTNDHGMVIKAIVAIWIVSISLGFPIFLGMNYPDNPSESECILYDANFIIFSSTASFFIPCFIILLFYYKIMKAILRQHRGGKSSSSSFSSGKKSDPASASAENAESWNNSTWTARLQSWFRRQRRQSRSSSSRNPTNDGTSNLELENTKNSPSDETGGGPPFLLRPGQGGIACTLSHIIRVSTNPLEKQDTAPPPNPPPTFITQQASPPMSSVPSPVKSQVERTQSRGTQTIPHKKGSSRNLSEPSSSRRQRPSRLLGLTSGAKDDLELAKKTSGVEKRNRKGSLFPFPTSNGSIPIVASSCDKPEKTHRRPSSSYIKEAPLTASDSSSPCNKVRCLVPRSPRPSALHNPNRLSAAAKAKSSSMRTLAVTFSLNTPDETSADRDQASTAKAALTPTASALSVPKSGLLRSISTSGSMTNVGNPSDGRRPSIGTSIKVLRRAATWKIRSQERLQAKRERRERRATKTLGIVLGCFLFCWIPFFTCNMLSALAMKLDMASLQPSIELFIITTWLGYVNSALNPLIYTFFNHEFRKAFKKIICIPDSSSTAGVRTNFAKV